MYKKTVFRQQNVKVVTQKIKVFTFERLHRRTQVIDIVKEQPIISRRRDKEAELSTS